MRALGLVKVDLLEVLDALQVPDDAGELAPALERVLRRIPSGWGRFLGCGPGWYPIVVRLDQALAEIDPGYELNQAKQKWGQLYYYAEPSPPACCVVWEQAHRRPEPGNNRGWVEWGQALEPHLDSAEHAAGEADRERRAEQMGSAIEAAKAEAAQTCELSGTSGAQLMVRGGWYRTLALAVGEAEGYRPA